MFKNVLLYRIGAQWKAPVARIEEALQRSRFVECRPSQEKSFGWAEPRGQAHGALVESVGAQLILKFMVETKLLPASVVRRAAQRKMDKIEARTGRKPGKKEAKELREATMAELLPRAFTKEAAVTVWIDPKARLLAIDTVSQARADEVNTALVHSLDGFTVAPIQTNSAPHTAMSLWLTERAAPGRFDFDRECELKSNDQAQALVRYSRHQIDIAEIRRHVEGGKLPTKLAMTWDGKISFLLTDAMQIKKVRFLDGVLKEDGGEDDDRFDADCAIVTGELGKLVPDLIAALGGEVATGR